jgi:hypothetical protein
MKVICRTAPVVTGKAGGSGRHRPSRWRTGITWGPILGQAVAKTVNAHRSRLAEPLAGAEDGPGHLEAEPEVVQPSKELKIVTRLREQHAAAHELWAQQMSKAAITEARAVPGHRPQAGQRPLR